MKSLLPRDTCTGCCIYVNLKPPAASYWFPFRENVLRLVGFPQQLSRWAAQMNIILSNQHQMLVVTKLLSFVYNGSSEGAISSSNLNRKVIFVFWPFQGLFRCWEMGTGASSGGSQAGSGTEQQDSMWSIMNKTWSEVQILWIWPMHRDLRFLVKVHAHMSICPQHVGGTHNVFYTFGFGNLGELVRYQDI